tara:strand:- start:2773 stop:3636 length:864 start_codon:yes stop_codon:yes gene_type:complete
MAKLSGESKVILIGASGYIGSHLLKKLPNKNIRFATSSSHKEGLKKFRLDSQKDLANLELNPRDFLIITATSWSPEYKEISLDKSREINIDGTKNLIMKALDKECRIIYFSSDTVYGNLNKICVEESLCKPIGDYAIMKLEIENYFKKEKNFKSIRLSYVYSKKDKFSQYLLNCSQQNKIAEIYHPFYRSAICIDDVINGIFSLINKWGEYDMSTINFGGPELLSRVDMAKIFKDFYLDNLEFKVNKPPDNFFLTRPVKIELNSDILFDLIEGNCTFLTQFLQNNFK